MPRAGEPSSEMCRGWKAARLLPSLTAPRHLHSRPSNTGYVKRSVNRTDMVQVQVVAWCTGRRWAGAIDVDGGCVSVKGG